MVGCSILSTRNQKGMLVGDQQLALDQRWQLPIAAISVTAVLTTPPRAGKSRGKTIRDQFRAIACGCSSGERSLLPVDALSASSSSPCAFPGRPGPRRGWLFLPRGLRNFRGYNWSVKAGPNDHLLWHSVTRPTIAEAPALLLHPLGFSCAVIPRLQPAPMANCLRSGLVRRRM